MTTFSVNGNTTIWSYAIMIYVYSQHDIIWAIGMRSWAEVITKKGGSHLCTVSTASCCNGWVGCLHMHMHMYIYIYTIIHIRQHVHNARATWWGYASCLSIGKGRVFSLWIAIFVYQVSTAICIYTFYRHIHIICTMYICRNHMCIYIYIYTL